MTKQDILTKIQSSALFRYYPEKDLKFLIDISTVLKYKNGDRILNEDDIGESLFLIVSGKVSVFINNKDSDVHLCTLEDGEFFGEAGLFLKVKRTASIAVVSDEVVLIEFPRDIILKYLKENSLVGNQFLLAIIFCLLKKMKSTNREIGSEKLVDVQQNDIDKIISEISE